MAHTVAAALVRDQPRDVSRRVHGAKRAAMMTATAMDAATLQRMVPRYPATTTSAVIAMRRQPRAARFPSQAGTAAYARAGSAGPVVTTSVSGASPALSA